MVVKTTKKQAVAAATSVAAQRWPHLLNETISTVVDPHLARPETRACARNLITALLAPLTRKNCWTLAEHTGHRSPYRMQHLLNRARLDEQALAAALRGYLTTRLGHQGVVLVVDETDDVKKGTSTVGVARQYSGTAGRIENCQVAVYLAYTTPQAHALIDQRLYLPRAWTDDPARLQKAGVPANVDFATKPELARQMIAAALEHTPDAWVAADEVYGRNPDLRTFLEESRIGYVMAIAATDRLSIPRGAVALKELAVLLPETAWQKRSAGAGAKGERFYDWALIDDLTDEDGVRWVLMRRGRTTGELAVYRCYAPEPVSLARLVAGGGVLPTGQGSGRVGRAPGADVDLLAAVEFAGDGPLRVRGPVPLGRARAGAGPGMVGGVDLQRDRSFAERPVRFRSGCGACAGVVGVQTLPPGTGQVLPLPQTGSPRIMTNRIYNWSINRQFGLTIDKSQ